MRKVEIQLLSDRLPGEHPEILAEIDLLREGLFKDIGWHYYVDLVWVVLQLRKMGIQPGSTILDAGAGSGLLQYLLSYYGYHVLSVDFAPRTVQFHIRKLFPVEVLTPVVASEEGYVAHMQRARGKFGFIHKIWNTLLKKRIPLASWYHLKKVLSRRVTKPGKIVMIQNDMRQMRQIKNQSVDAVVSVSAVEHLQPDQLPLVFSEFGRVMRSDAPLILTTNASGTQKDWFHKPSQGWCFSLATLSAWFDDSSSQVRHFSNFNRVLADYQNNEFLQKRLSRAYFFSSENGMPNGIWNPVYIPAGVVARRSDLVDRRGERDGVHA